MALAAVEILDQRFSGYFGANSLTSRAAERSAGQAGGIQKYRRLALLDTYVLWLAKARRPPSAVGE